MQYFLEYLEGLSSLEHLLLLYRGKAVPSIHAGWLTTTFKPSSKKSDAFLWPLQASAHVYSCTYTHLHTVFLFLELITTRWKGKKITAENSKTAARSRPTLAWTTAHKAGSTLHTCGQLTWFLLL